MESGAIFVALIVTLFLSYILAEFFGRSRHIGFGWTFAISASTGFIGGVVALAVSPSARKEPTLGGKGYKTGAWVCLILAILNLLTLNPLTLGLFILSFYLLELSNGEIINDNPKFFFSKLNSIRSLRHNFFQKSESQQYSSGTKKVSSYNLKQKKEFLQSLHEKGLLNQEEFITKIDNLKKEELEDRLKNSSEFNQLEVLFLSGVLTKEEFDKKIEVLKLNIEKKSSTPQTDSIKLNSNTNSFDAKQWKIFISLATLVGLIAIIWYLVDEGILFTWSNPYF